MIIVDVVSGLLIFIGVVFLFGGALGLLRMPDLYTRIHAASLIDTGGMICIILGLLLQNIFFFENIIAGSKLILLLVFIAFTAPTASHAIAKMALMAGLVPECQNGRSVIEKSLLIDVDTKKNNTSIGGQGNE